jgi:folylpolyglutamate synthase/dihydropteroate synthase
LADMWDYTDYLYAHSTNRTVDDIRILNGLLGNPEQSMLCIQIAGTNGKGSTSNIVLILI